MKKVHVLLIEDNEGDILMIQEAFEERNIIEKISVVTDGKTALEFLFQTGEYKNVEKPDIILLDINLPIKNGHEVLMAIKKNALTCKIPVIVLTTSSSQNDIDLSYEHQANSYVTKPIEVDAFYEAIHKIEDFWIQLAKLPKIA